MTGKIQFGVAPGAIAQVMVTPFSRWLLVTRSSPSRGTAAHYPPSHKRPSDPHDLPVRRVRDEHRSRRQLLAARGADITCGEGAESLPRRRTDRHGSLRAEDP